MASNPNFSSQHIRCSTWLEPGQWRAIQSIGVINRVLAEIGEPTVQDLPAVAKIVPGRCRSQTMIILDMPSRVAFAARN